MSEADARLVSRFQASLAECGVGPGDRLLVAFSGGRDSAVLLYLLRFRSRREEGALAAAHFDHAMRPGSRGDAAWAAGLCASWGVPLAIERAARPPSGEAEARRLRYAFLRRAAEGAGASWIATAHHADDQAETVLFRALRGTGPTGLAGIAPRRGTLVRPLLSFWRAELRAYALAVGLRWRPDPSNRSLGPARNRLRRQILPRLERTVAPAARRNLVRLAAVAREERLAWDAAAERLAAEAVRAEGEQLLLLREPFRAWGEALAAKVLRGVLERRGVSLGRAGTRRMIQFITDSPSGRVLQLPERVRLYAEPERVLLSAEAPAPLPDWPLRLGAADAARAGTGEARIGGRRVRMEWRQGPALGDTDPGAGAELRLEELRFPLELRGRRAGDRIRAAGGTKPLKKLLIERRVGRLARPTLPLLAAGGEVLWVRGLTVAVDRRADPGEPALLVRVSDA